MGAAVGFAGSEVARPDHFDALANLADPAMAVEHERVWLPMAFAMISSR
jgi:hypothetical protein